MGTDANKLTISKHTRTELGCFGFWNKVCPIVYGIMGLKIKFLGKNVIKEFT